MKDVIIVVTIVALMANMLPVQGMQLNNPGNIRHGPKWQGLSSYQPHKSFAKFNSDVYGYRAMAKLLLTYERKYKLDSVSKIIHRYAPPSENPTQEYIQFVAKQSGFTTWSHLNLNKEEVLFSLCKSMARFEQGVRFNDSDETIMAGVRMALNGT